MKAAFASSIVFIILTCGLAEAQYSMGRPTGPPGQQARPAATLTLEEQKGFLEAMKKLRSKDRKRLTNAIKRFTPEEKKQFIESVKRQLAVKGTAQALKKRR